MSITDEQLETIMEEEMVSEVKWQNFLEGKISIHISVLYKVLIFCSHDWRDLGAALGVSSIYMDQIALMEFDVDMRLLVVLQRWMTTDNYKI